MGQVAVITDTKDPNWGLPPSGPVVTDTKDPNWGMPPTGDVDAPSDSRALVMAAAGKAIPAAGKATSAFVSNPAVPRIAAKVGRVVGGVAPIVAGATEGGVVGGLAGVAAASRGAWAGGKTGWFTGKLLQNVSAPVARAFQTIAPYAQAVNTMAGAQGVLDLAQMADKTRTDIGTLGFSLEGRSKADRDAHPALVNAVVGKIGELASNLKNNGIPAAEAVAIKLLSDGNQATFGNLLTLYMGQRPK